MTNAQQQPHEQESLKAEDMAILLGGGREKLIYSESMNGFLWWTRCPAHEDKGLSLRLYDGPNGIRYTCKAGCERTKVIGYALAEFATSLHKTKSKKVVSIVRSERIKNSWNGIRKNFGDLVKELVGGAVWCAKEAEWHLQRLLH